MSSLAGHQQANGALDKDVRWYDSETHTSLLEINSNSVESLPVAPDSEPESNWKVLSFSSSKDSSIGRFSNEFCEDRVGGVAAMAPPDMFDA